MPYSTQILILCNETLAAMGAKNTLDNHFPDSFIKCFPTKENYFIELNKRSTHLPLAIIFCEVNEFPEILNEIKKLKEHTQQVSFLFFLEQKQLIRYSSSLLSLGVEGLLLKTADIRTFLVAARELLSGGTFIQRAVQDQIANKSIESSIDDTKNPFERLSKNEHQVAQQLVKGVTQKQIAINMVKSQSTIATYASRIMKKLNIKSLIELLDLAKKFPFID